VHNVSDIYIGSASNYNDYGLLKLSTPINLGGSRMKAVKLPSKQKYPDVGTNCHLQGWGGKFNEYFNFIEIFSYSNFYVKFLQLTPMIHTLIICIELMFKQYLMKNVMKIGAVQLIVIIKFVLLE
jgi:hypothetical protein